MRGRVAAVVATGSVLAMAALGATGCKAVRTDDALPGHSRPIVVHDWPHPRDYRFAPSAFHPPDPSRVLVKTASGVRAYVISNPSDPVVRITAAFPLGRFYERRAEAGASDLIAQLITQRGPAGGSKP